MNAAIRLIRLSLIVQVALALFAIVSDVIASGGSFTANGNVASPFLWGSPSALTQAVLAANLLGTLPVIVLLAGACVPRIVATRRSVQVVLALMIAVFTWQINAPGVAATRLAVVNPVIGKPLYEIIVGGDSPASLVAGPVSVLLLFALLPAVIGASLGGRRTAITWAFIANVLSVTSAIAVWVITPIELRSDDRTADVVIWMLGQCLVIGMVCYFVGALAEWQRDERAQVEQANAQLAEANRQLAKQAQVSEQLAASRERVQLARDLHDTLAHTLAGLTVQLDAITAIIGTDIAGGIDGAMVKGELARASRLAHDGLDTARNAITGLRVDAVGELGLNGAIRRRLKVMEQRVGTHAELLLERGEPTFDNVAAQSVYGIVQESLNNVERHANAQHVCVTLTPNSLIIRDDGIGFDGTVPETGRYGMRGMRERAAALGARLMVHSRAGNGTTIEVRW